MVAKPKAEIIKRPAEKIGGDIKKTAWNAALESFIILVFGILIAVWPDATISIVANILGAIFIINGLYKIINYLVIQGQKNYLNDSLLAGVISFLIGIAILLVGGDIANVFRVIIGIWVIYESLVRINAAIKLHSAGANTWSYLLAIALIMLGLGLFITFNTGAVIQLIGIVMIIVGAIGIVGDVMFIRQIDIVVDKVTKAFKH